VAFTHAVGTLLKPRREQTCCNSTQDLKHLANPYLLKGLGVEWLFTVRKVFTKKAWKLRPASYICKSRCRTRYIWISGFFWPISSQSVAALRGLIPHFYHPCPIIKHEIHQHPLTDSACSWASVRLGTMKGCHLGVSFPS